MYFQFPIMITELEEPWRYTKHEAAMVTEANQAIEAQPDFSYRKSEHDYLNEEWPDEDRITRIVIDDSTEDLPETETEAINLISQRFGCVYAKLSEGLRHNISVIFAATVESGHNLRHVPEDARQKLTPEFFIEAMRAGTMGWILKYASEDVCRNEEVQMLAIGEHPYNEKFIIDPSPKVSAHIEEKRSEVERQAEAWQAKVNAK